MRIPIKGNCGGLKVDVGEYKVWAVVGEQDVWGASSRMSNQIRWSNQLKQLAAAGPSSTLKRNVVRRIRDHGILEIVEDWIATSSSARELGVQLGLRVRVVVFRPRKAHFNQEVAGPGRQREALQVRVGTSSVTWRINDVDNVTLFDKVAGETSTIVWRVQPACATTASSMKEDDRIGLSGSDRADLLDVELVRRELALPSSDSAAADVEEVARIGNRITIAAFWVDSVDTSAIDFAKVGGR